MESIEKYYDCLDHRTVSTLILRTKPKKEFIKTLGPEDLYESFIKSKVGYIKVHKISDNPGIPKSKVYEGVTGAFGEGLAVWISNPSSWFHSSTIKDIDWENNVFHTLNSTYAFEFEELDYKQLVTNFLNSEINSAPKKK